MDDTFLPIASLAAVLSRSCTPTSRLPLDVTIRGLGTEHFRSDLWAILTMECNRWRTLDASISELLDAGYDAPDSLAAIAGKLPILEHITFTEPSFAYDPLDTFQECPSLRSIEMDELDDGVLLPWSQLSSVTGVLCIFPRLHISMCRYTQALSLTFRQRQPDRDDHAEEMGLQCTKLTLMVPRRRVVEDFTLAITEFDCPHLDTLTIAEQSGERSDFGLRHHFHLPVTDFQLFLHRSPLLRSLTLDRILFDGDILPLLAATPLLEELVIHKIPDIPAHHVTYPRLFVFSHTFLQALTIVALPFPLLLPRLKTIDFDIQDPLDLFSVPDFQAMTVSRGYVVGSIEGVACLRTVKVHTVNSSVSEEIRNSLKDAVSGGLQLRVECSAAGTGRGPR